MGGGTFSLRRASLAGRLSRGRDTIVVGNSVVGDDVEVDVIGDVGLLLLLLLLLVFGLGGVAVVVVDVDVVASDMI